MPLTKGLHLSESEVNKNYEKQYWLLHINTSNSYQNKNIIKDWKKNNNIQQFNKAQKILWIKIQMPARQWW